MTAVGELLPAYAIGALDEVDTALVERVVASDLALSAEVAALERVVADLAEAPAPCPPPRAIRERLMASTVGPFERFSARFATLFDVTVERARDLLAMATSPSAWEPGPQPGTWLLHFAAGPAYAAADAGFVKLDPGSGFPWHRHHGDEHGLVLGGAAVDTLAGALRPGDEPTAGADTVHDFRAVGDEPFILAVRVFGVTLE